ncbi:hypothetical protein SYNPS1DRAFT_21650 [Syncephalis pseudoplumigaleata]|uniref:Lung seven transmembrane receptor-domain-containing protein n=1 Tax=Syncephalis pseudoplumigaleata TaxID=1712513 RepID=A0A4P9Z277_9FUNG|nr:hypothetical protein SYNPS1DRAFT_21650 [Syncephalis pseudoplumigaleata]|eukprot:RKP26627.1 hypothetical protein SYNPS1DRAFT_21650 [Syncephalis pseudoplumigaleata]
MIRFHYGVRPIARCSWLLLGVVVHLLVLACQSTASVTFTHKGAKYNYSTFDPLLVDAPSYKLTGPIYMPQFAANEACKLSLADAHANSSILTFAAVSAIAVVDTSTALAYGCETWAQISMAVDEYNRALPPIGNHSISALLLLLQKDNAAVQAGPQSPLAISRRPTISDGNPALPTALLPAAYLDGFTAVMASASKPLLLTLQQERGPWNNVLLSHNYSVVRWILAACCAYFLGYSLVKVLILLRARTFRREKSLAVLALAAIASVFIIAYISLNAYTLTAQVLLRVGSIVLWAALSFAIHLWCSTVDQIRNTRNRPFRIILRIAMVMCMATLFVESITNAATTTGLFHEELAPTVARWLIDDFCRVMRCIGLLSVYAVEKMDATGPGSSALFYSIYSRKWTWSDSRQSGSTQPRTMSKLYTASGVTMSSLPSEHPTVVQLPSLHFSRESNYRFSALLYDNPLFAQNTAPTGHCLLDSMKRKRLAHADPGSSSDNDDDDYDDNMTTALTEAWQVNLVGEDETRRIMKRWRTCRPMLR